MGRAVPKDADAAIDALIEQRSRGAQQERAKEVWDASARRYAAKLRDRARWEHIRYREHMAQLHRRLADEHEQEAQKLLENGGGYAGSNGSG